LVVLPESEHTGVGPHVSLAFCLGNPFHFSIEQREVVVLGKRREVVLPVITPGAGAEKRRNATKVTGAGKTNQGVAEQKVKAHKYTDTYRYQRQQ
jgi:hypothetical protein